MIRGSNYVALRLKVIFQIALRLFERDSPDLRREEIVQTALRLFGSDRTVFDRRMQGGGEWYFFN